jgi:hypothetical protein
MVKIFRTLRACLCAACLLISVSSVSAQGGSPTFQPRYVPEISPTPPRRLEPSKPLPRWLKAGVGVVALAVSGVILYFSSKAWRTANIFESKYRFPRARDAALRFGGNRSGGAMAAIEPINPKESA